MADLYLRPGVTSFESDQVPVLDKILQLIEDFANGNIEGENLADGSIGTDHYAAASVTQAKVADGVAKIASASYTGDGTSSRVIAVGFRPRHVLVLRHSNSDVFESLGTASALLAAWYRDSNGTMAAAGTEFTGVSATGFTLGSAAGGGRSNANTETYSYVAVG